MTLLTYPRKQQNRRLVAALRHASLALVALLLSALAASADLRAIAALLLVLSMILGFRSRRSLRLAHRSAVGARSEKRVRQELQVLTDEGWSVRNSLRWHGGGDIDHVAIAPPACGLAFAIETKTRSYRPHDLARITAVCQWLDQRRTGWCRHGVVPVLCLAGSHGIERWEAGVTVVSADRLVAVLSRLAGTTRKPGFLR